jgi:hypothetical protein
VTRPVPRPVEAPRLGAADPGLVAAPGGRWPARRRVAALVLAVGLVLLVAAGPGWAFASEPVWSLLTLAAVLASAAAAATFVPLAGEGLHVHLGCAPCAAVGGLAAIGGAWLALTSAHDGGTASLALALSGFALARRLTEPQTCDRSL